MGKKRVHEIAKEQNLPSKEVLERLQAAGIEAKAAASSVDEAAALKALGMNGGAVKASATPKATAPVKPVPAAGAARPGAPAPRAPKAPAVPKTPASLRRQAPVPVTKAPAAAPAPAVPERRVFEPDAPPPMPAGRRVFEPDAPPPPRPTRRGPAAPTPAPPPPRPRAGSATQLPSDPRSAAKAPAAPATAAEAPAGPKIIAQPAATPAPAAKAATPAAPVRPAKASAAAPPKAPRPRPAGTAAFPAPPPPKPRAPKAEPEPVAQAPATQAPAVEAPAAEPDVNAGSSTTPTAPVKIVPHAEPPAPGAGPKIISVPEPPKKPKRDETKTGPTRPGGLRGGLREGGAGAGAGGKRRVVIDSQASRRPGGPGGPGGPPVGGFPQRRPRRRGRRRFDDTPLQELDTSAQSATDEVKIASGSTVKDVAEYLGVGVPEIIKQLMTMGEMATLTQTLSDEAILILAEALGKEVEIVGASEEDELEPEFDDAEADLVERPPVVTIMGHVDHGKTSLLDAIRRADVVAGEAGGITQHIGAYQVHHGDRTITFLDTPGHEAFTAMRARGAKVTDVAVVVVAADDGPKPQTDEAIDHAKAAEVPVIVAVNKIDKEGADPTRVRTEMTTRGLQPSDWGGETEYVDVSAKTHVGLEDLLDTILVVTELEELKANPDAEASGVVIESKLDPGRGPVVTVLIQRGTLRVGDSLVAGPHWGKVRAMQDYTGARTEEARPGDPVEVLGFDGVPDAGEYVRAVESDRVARQQANERSIRLKNEAQARRAGRKVSFDELFQGIQEGVLKDLNLVLKADVSGSLEAFEDEIAKLPQDEVVVNIIHGGVGGINESDVMLAAASDAIILGFNVRPVGDARAVAEREGVEIRTYAVIYKALDELRDAMSGMLEPEEVEDTLGQAEVRQTFKASRIGTIAGCYVTDGKITRNARIRVVRDGTVVYETTLASLKRFNEDVREVASGFECGIVLANFQDVKEGDVLEAFETRKVERELG